jgi:uncharacterized protein (TIGR04552 family)
MNRLGKVVHFPKAVSGTVGLPMTTGYRSIDDFSLSDLEAIWNILRGDSVIDWKRLNFTTAGDAEEFLSVQGFTPELPLDQERMEAIKHEAISYLRRNFEYPIPRPVAECSVVNLMLMAAGKGHKQVCACVILKVMHIIHHLQGRELLYVLPLSDAEVFQLVEQKIYRVIGGMLEESLPITEFLGGRKSRDSLYTKLLSKSETIAAQIYDKVRFRIVTRTTEDLIPVLSYLSRRLFPFNYAIPGESYNTLLDPREYARSHPRLSELLASPNINPHEDPLTSFVDNKFSARSYRVIHFVVDMPVRVPDRVLAAAPPAAEHLGHIVFVLVEFQIVDQNTERANEAGEASHAQYKERQMIAVRDRLQLGIDRVKRVRKS